MKEQLTANLPLGPKPIDIGMVEIEQRVIGRRKWVAHLAQLASYPKVAARVVPHTIQG
jgi:hypothetical protein